MNNSGTILTCKLILKDSRVNSCLKLPTFCRPTNASFYENKNVYILGAGNAAFETADSMKSKAAAIIVSTRSKEVPVAYQTHYVGNLRAVNAQLLDLYQLKSLAAIVTNTNANDFEMFQYSKVEKKWILLYLNESAVWNNRIGRFVVDPPDHEKTLKKVHGDDGFELIKEHKFDEVISCMGLFRCFHPWQNDSILQHLLFRLVSARVDNGL